MHSVELAKRREINQELCKYHMLQPRKLQEKKNVLNLENGKSWTLPTVVKFPRNSLRDICASQTAIGKGVQPAGAVVFNMPFRKARGTLESSEKSDLNSLMLP